MLLWGLAVGALLGWVISDFEAWGAIVGALPGMAAMNWLRSEIRAEIRASIEREQEVFHDLARAAAADVVAKARPQVDPGVARAEAVPPKPEPRTPPPPRTVSDDKPANLAPVVALAAQPEVVVESEQEQASPVEALFAAARGWIFGGNTIVRVGLIILFVGLSFLARYAAMAGLFPIELRLSLVAAAGITLLVTGFLRRRARPEFALALQGAGVAVIYLTIFAASRFYDLLPMLPAFVLMLVVCALACALALLQRSQSLALAAFIGGFAVPLLLGGEGSSVGLFGYYAVLNIAVLLLVWRTNWHMLGLIAFLATFGVMGAWVTASYTLADYASTQAFLILFMLVHVAMAIMSARPLSGTVGRMVNGTMLFGPALAGLGIQIALVRHLELGSAFSALGFAALYLVVAALLRKRNGAAHALMVDAFLAIGVGALTLAVPLALGASWTSAVWAAEGAAAVWIGLRQSRWLPRVFGLVLIAVASLVFLTSIENNVSALPIVGENTLGAAIVALSLLLASWLLRDPAPAVQSRLGSVYSDLERLLPFPLFVAGFLFWCLAIGLEATRMLPPQQNPGQPSPAISFELQGLVLLLGVMASAGIALWLGRHLGWRIATWPSRLTLLPIALTFAATVGEGQSLLQHPGWIFWLAVLGLHYLYLYQNDRADSGPAAVQRIAHVGSIWLLMGVLANSLWFGIDRAGLWNSGWAEVVFLLSTFAVLALLALWAGRANRADTLGQFGWPLNPHARGYWWQAALPVAALLWLGALALAFTASGDARPLPYLPILNPVDLSLALALGGLLLWRRCIGSADPQPALAAMLAGREGKLLLAALAFLALNSVWLRIAHHYLGVPWSISSMASDSSVQAGLAILWTVLALGLMLLAHRRTERPLWLAGAGLLGAVVLKLLLVDLSSAAGGQRIIAFIGVGVLMLVVGYFVPLPPKAQNTEVAE